MSPGSETDSPTLDRGNRPAWMSNGPEEDDDDEWDDDEVIVQNRDVITLTPAGPWYGTGRDSNVLEPGSPYPPTSASSATLRRSEDGLAIKVVTSGLPPGAYTAWWAYMNTPENCEPDIEPTGAVCATTDMVVIGERWQDGGFRPNPDVDLGITWSTGVIVGKNGKAVFKDKLTVDDPRFDNPRGSLKEHVFPNEGDQGGEGRHTNPLSNPEGLHLHYIIKYHGPVADDPDLLQEQLQTRRGNCDTPADGKVDTPGGDPLATNTLPIFGREECFNPQRVVFPSPELVDLEPGSHAEGRDDDKGAEGEGEGRPFDLFGEDHPGNRPF